MYPPMYTTLCTLPVHRPVHPAVTVLHEYSAVHAWSRVWNVPDLPGYRSRARMSWLRCLKEAKSGCSYWITWAFYTLFSKVTPQGPGPPCRYSSVRAEVSRSDQEWEFEAFYIGIGMGFRDVTTFLLISHYFSHNSPCFSPVQKRPGHIGIGMGFRSARGEVSEIS